MDAACLAWLGREAVEHAVEHAVDAATLARARVWTAVIRVEQLAGAVCDNEPPDILAQYVAGVASWLRRTPLG